MTSYNIIVYHIMVRYVMLDLRAAGKDPRVPDPDQLVVA